MSQQHTPGPVIGSVFERKPTSSSKPPAGPQAPRVSTSTGFPPVQHRSKSAFARNREEQLRRNPGSSRLQAPPAVPATDKLTSPLRAPPPRSSAPSDLLSDDAVREQISRENEARIAGMTPEEVEDERRQILERFGAGIGSVLEKAKRNRMKRASETVYSGRSGAASPLPPPLDEEATRRALQNLQEGQCVP